MYKHKDIKEKEKLNIGYILPDFRQHEVACISYPLLMSFNEGEFNVFCYANSDVKELRERVRNPNILWRNIAGISVELAVRGIQKDKIDILVDLSSHTSSNCLPILSRKPAIVQMSSIGYFNTTGLKTVEYLLTDKYCSPEEQDQDYFVEDTLLIPQSHFCYHPSTESAAYEEAPMTKNGYVTFGCFHHFTHVTDEFLSIWQAIIAQVPNARLIIKSRIFGSGYGCQEARFRLKRLGFDLNRVELRPMRSDDMDDYRDVDILLDTCPYQGVSTTCDALYMGVPVIVTAGIRHSSRLGYSILKNIGLEECIAETTDEYIDKAITLANNQYKVMNLHKNLRERMQKSPLMDERRYVANVERLYKKVWKSIVDEVQTEKILKEVSTLLWTVEEGLVYLHGRLVLGDLSEVIVQIFDDTAYAFKNIQVALQGLNSNTETILCVIKKCNKARQLCKSKQGAKASECIAMEIMPHIKEMIKWVEVRLEK